MFANTLRARALLKLAFEACHCAVAHTYTEKTSERDPKRRSVVFPVYGDSEKVLKIATQMFKECGYNESIPKLTVSDTMYGSEYIRVIAYID
jgi:hypothetical protein